MDCVLVASSVGVGVASSVGVGVSVSLMLLEAVDEELEDVAEIIAGAKKPLVIVGGEGSCQNEGYDFLFHRHSPF